MRDSNCAHDERSRELSSCGSKWVRVTAEVDTITVNVEAAVGPEAVALWHKGRGVMGGRRRTPAHAAKQELR